MAGIAGWGKLALAEFVGTFAIVFIGAGSLVVDGIAPDGVGITGRALAYGFTVAVMFYSLAHISGGHFNPAVTFGFLVTRRVSLRRAGTYVASQILGALAASMVLKTLIPSEVPGAASLGAPALNFKLSSLDGILIELFLTFFLVFVFFGTAVDPRSPKAVAGFAIGFTVAVDMMMGSFWTGGIANPARAFGPTAAVFLWDAFGRVTSVYVWQSHYIYWIGPLAGAGFAALTYQLVLLRDE